MMPLLRLLLAFAKTKKHSEDCTPTFFLSESFELDDVSFAYSGSSEKSLVNATIKVSKGLSVGIIGESGSGKSTFVDIALGLLEPDEGRILVDGKRIAEDLHGNG